MIRLSLDAKSCMSALLLGQSFDPFLFIEGEITTFNTFTIDGYLHKEFFGEDAPDAAYSTWEAVKGFCLAVIKGKQPPLHFRFIFSLPEDQIESIIKEQTPEIDKTSVQGLYLNFQFAEGKLSCTTGTSLKIFTLDKSLEHAFDQWTRGFFSKLGINWED